MSHLVLTRKLIPGRNAFVINEDLRIEIERIGTNWLRVHFIERGESRKYTIRRAEVKPRIVNGVTCESV